MKYDLWEPKRRIETNYSQTLGNKFENASYEGLLIRGTCEGVRISENKFILNGSDYATLETRYAAIRFTDNDTTGARAMAIRGNDFGIPSNTPYNSYCIAEAENTDDSYITGNYLKYGYQTAPKLIYGASTVATPNFGE
jgi:nitrous oxidase accessory protein NosD